MQWFPSTEEEIAIATREVTLTDQDVLGLFTASQPELTRSDISASLSAEGFIVSEDRLDRKLATLEANGKLVKLPATLTGEATYLKATAAKKREKETSALEAILEFVRKAGEAGANITEIRAAMKEIRIGSGTVTSHLGELVKADLIFAEERGKEKRYFAVRAA
jgi:DNA-binding transcriptional ArsR family regulator